MERKPDKLLNENKLKSLRKYARDISGQIGIYKFIAENDEILYIGKALNLRNRVMSHLSARNLTRRHMLMLNKTVKIETIQTVSEAEALLLEANMIKHHMPRYNILLRDDKSFPYILLTGNHDYPQIVKHRGRKSNKGDYFGPFPSAGAVRTTIKQIQKVFLLRPCSDNIFKSRKRPCLQYQIKRCSAPCVGKIDKRDYGKLVSQAKNFLSGKTATIQNLLEKQMHQYSKEEQFEKAASTRDRIKELTAIQSQQNPDIKGDADFLALYREGKDSCILAAYFRSGNNYGYFPYYINCDENEESGEIMEAFIGQSYMKDKTQIFVSDEPNNLNIIKQGGLEVKKITRGRKRQFLDIMQKRAEMNLQQHLKERINLRKYTGWKNESEAEIMKELWEFMELESPSELGEQRIEIFDNSHISGKFAVGAMVVFAERKLQKNQYRQFNIKTPQSRLGGDDYGMLREVLQRRLRYLLGDKIKKGDENNMANFPDLLLVDGGAGHVRIVNEVLADLGLRIDFVCIAKGKERNAGNESFHLANGEVKKLPKDSRLLNFLQILRDEAHNYAINKHRHRRESDIYKSKLDMIEGIGVARKKKILLHIGGASAVAKASIAEISAIPGISEEIAKRIYNFFHDG